MAPRASPRRRSALIAWIGRPIHAGSTSAWKPAMTPRSIRLRNRVRQVEAAMPEVLNVYFLAGADDFHVHVAAKDPDDLRTFVVDHLSSAPEVALTETNLIFEHKRGRLAK